MNNPFAVKKETKVFTVDCAEEIIGEVESASAINDNEQPVKETITIQLWDRDNDLVEYEFVKIYKYEIESTTYVGSYSSKITRFTEDRSTIPFKACKNISTFWIRRSTFDNLDNNIALMWHGLESEIISDFAFTLRHMADQIDLLTNQEEFPPDLSNG